MITLRHFEPADKAITNQQAWNADKLQEHDTWRQNLTNEVLAEFKSFCFQETITKNYIESCQFKTLHLPQLKQLSLKIREDILHGEGVVWLKGLSPSDFSQDEITFFYSLLGEYMGNPFAEYGRLFDVQDSGQKDNNNHAPLSQSTRSLSYHTDSTNCHCLPDMVGLLCLQPSLKGGESQLSSAVTAHNNILHQQPDALKYLYRDYIRDLLSATTECEAAQVEKNCFPIFYFDEEKQQLTFRYMRHWIEKGHEHVHAPLEKAYLEIFDLLDEELSSVKNSVSFRLGAGDMLWTNNRTIAHNRTAYEDDANHPRHMVRMWLQCGCKS